MMEYDEGLTPVEEYNGGIIIYSLGDFINDYAVKERYESDKALIVEVEVNDNQLSHNLIHKLAHYLFGNLYRNNMKFLRLRDQTLYQESLKILGQQYQ